MTADRCTIYRPWRSTEKNHVVYQMEALIDLPYFKFVAQI